jgi:amino acid adenylation domain-containing protein
MNEGKEAGSLYWRGVLTEGGFTAIPRWTSTPMAGVAVHQLPLPADLVASLTRLADESSMPFESVLLAAHAKVLSALAGEQLVTTGYVAAKGDPALPCRLALEAVSWGALLLDVRAAETELRSHAQFPVDDLREALRLTEPLFEVVFDPTDGDGPLSEEVVLRLGVARDSNRIALRLQYRTDALDEAAAARIAGYHVTALRRITADPDAEHGRQSLLDAEELRFQLEALAGPRRELPNCRAHDLFEQHARAHPDVVAAVHGDRRWTYAELNARANRLGRALLNRGVEREAVVAVVTERNLDWMAAVLAVFKAGGVYLPIEPHFPADRIASMLSRSGCRLVLTERESTTTLDAALATLPGIETIFVDTISEEMHAADLRLAVAPEQLAYIYFTSGSTGEPKGAMCEHAGMLNHLHAKLDDLEIREGQTVAQIAPQCFDISLWQLLSAVLTGGRTVIIEQEVILDVQRFVDKIVDERVNVLQVVPSYLEVVLSYLEASKRELPDLRYVSVTGEALTKELAERWFASEPGIKLVNAYGLTETSDDTNHEVMDRPPVGKHVPLGRAINNVHVYVVDANLNLVPLGAPGEIVFSGVCVGRGYINDPERTRLAFLDDPIRQGERLYRSGDFGRWSPNGKLEFLGRRDAQVKIRGFRIEIGDIENNLLRLTGVRQGAVVVVERADRTKQLVGFYSGRRLEVGHLQEMLGRSLPEYMVPSNFHWRKSLPLTGNGKIDRKALRALAGELEAAGCEREAPRTETEKRLAAVWAKVLGVSPDQVDRRDNFFDRGGTSLSAVKLVIGLNQAVSLKVVTAHPVLADLAELLDGTSRANGGLLQPLTETSSTQENALVCFPYAGGNAVNFQPMALALRESGIPLFAVELPGHDLGTDDGKLAPMDEVVDQVVSEITERKLTGLSLWGHSSGAVFALETARRLQEKGVEVRRVFVGALLPGDAAGRRAAILELNRRSQAEIYSALGSRTGDEPLGELDDRQIERAGATYKHDLLAAHQYLANVLDHPPAAKLTAPITVIGAADDPTTSELRQRYRDWHVLADEVDVHVLDDGGHYFLRTRPAEAARIVLRGSD